MSSSLKRTIHALELISQIKQKKLRDDVLKDLRANKILYKALREIAINVTNGNIKLSDSDKTKLRKDAHIIEQLAAPKVTKRQKTKLVEQSGGFLPVLVPLVVSVITEILNGAL